MSKTQFKIFTTRVFTKAELERGIKTDFPTDVSELLGVAVIPQKELDPFSLTSIKVDDTGYIETAPTSLFMSSLSVPVDRRFFTKAGRMKTGNRKVYLTMTEAEDSLIMFLLRKK